MVMSFLCVYMFVCVFPLFLLRTEFFGLIKLIGARNVFVVITQLNSESMGSVNEFVYQKLALFMGVFWFSVSRYMLPLFGFISTYVLRFQGNVSSSKNNSDYSNVISEQNNKQISNLIELEESKQEIMGFSDSENDGLCEKESPKFCFQFKFPTYDEEVSKSFKTFSPTSMDKYEFMSGKGFSGFIDEPEVVNFEVKEVETDTNTGSLEDKDMVDDDDGFLSDKDDVNGVELTEEIDAIALIEENGEFVNLENSLQGDEKESSMESEPDSISPNHLSSIMSRFVYSYGKNHDSEDFDEEDSDVMEELRNLEEAQLQNSEKFNSNFFHEELFSGKDDKPINDLDDSGTAELKNESVLDSEDSNKLETLWEHQELVEQLKMELKKVRATGLPTILEESESPKIMEDLKPWKIDEKFQHENPMGELQKFYKSYRERMRKFDILSYQKMYAIGFLQLKDPHQSISNDKFSVPDLNSLLLQNSCPCKHKNNESDPTIKFIKELQSDLEVVYVGQMCLSWEILHWQYGKALDLWETDSRGVRRFNEVAGEFQQFQVLMQRFIEDEPFQGPRVQNYVKNRCLLRNLLQVPVIRVDRLKDKKKERLREGGEYAITSDMLVEIMEESIRVFWRFVRADKGCNCNNVIGKGRKETAVELQDPADDEVLREIQKNLQKKERKLKELLRSGKCILRRFQKCQDDSSDQVFYFFSQVDMKLVSRVLNMSRLTTDQLVWCSNKLSNISFINRKIHVEPSFLLFPC